MKKFAYSNLFLLFFLAIVFLISVSFGLIKTTEDNILDSFRKVSEHVDENELCFKCHDKTINFSEQDGTDNKDTMHLKESQIITREKFYRSNHRSLACIGCHTDEDTGLKDQSANTSALSRTCNDCHLYIKKHQHFQFAAIEEEYLQSVHYQKKQNEFSCWKCHNPHIDRIHYRDTINLTEAITYNNLICLSCHKNASPFKELHSWLPEKEKHFENLRCIDCHTKENTNILVAHLVMPKEKSVKKCSACHYSNSLLITTLYKNQVADTLNKSGLFNAMVTADVYISGANRSESLNLITLIILGFVFAGILLHMIPRFIAKSESRNKPENKTLN